MLCQKCKKNHATTHIHSVINGVVSEIELCSACAAESGYTTTVKSPLVDMLASVFGDFSSVPVSLSAVRCDCCGSVFADIAKTGKVGCANCYEIFGNELLPYIKRVHGTTKHIGKKPNNAALVVSKKDEIAELRLKLKELIEKENFEEAAVVRDEIKKAEGENADE